MSIKSSTIATRFSINASPSGLRPFPSSSNIILAATAARLQNSAFQPIALEDTTKWRSNIHPLVTIVTTIKSTGNCWPVKILNFFIAIVNVLTSFSSFFGNLLLKYQRFSIWTLSCFSFQTIQLSPHWICEELLQILLSVGMFQCYDGHVFHFRWSAVQWRSSVFVKNSGFYLNKGWWYLLSRRNIYSDTTILFDSWFWKDSFWKTEKLWKVIFFGFCSSALRCVLVGKRLTRQGFACEFETSIFSQQM